MPRPDQAECSTDIPRSNHGNPHEFFLHDPMRVSPEIRLVNTDHRSKGTGLSGQLASSGLPQLDSGRFIVIHLVDLVEEGGHERIERRKVAASPKSLPMPFRALPLNEEDEPLPILRATQQLISQAVGGIREV